MYLDKVGLATVGVLDVVARRHLQRVDVGVGRPLAAHKVKEVSDAAGQVGRRRRRRRWRSSLLAVNAV